MRKTKETLSRLGLAEKEIITYLKLLELGPSSIRKIAEKTNINRGTTHDALKTLQAEGLVSYYHKKTHQYFVAEDPIAIQRMVKKNIQELKNTEEALNETIPLLRSLWSEIEERPVAKYYEGYEGILTILQDVLNSTEKTKEKEYSIYSSSEIKPHLYKTFENYNEERIKRGITVRAISIGAGGKEIGLDKRKWLTKKGGAPTYTFIYSNKIAIISVDKNNTPHGVVIEDTHIFNTQLLIFNWAWSKLK
jgi:HTH-type transcriptional regulator, sugar sensing transcriptional regulator